MIQKQTQGLNTRDWTWSGLGLHTAGNNAIEPTGNCSTTFPIQPTDKSHMVSLKDIGSNMEKLTCYTENQDL